MIVKELRDILDNFSDDAKIVIQKKIDKQRHLLFPPLTWRKSQHKGRLVLCNDVESKRIYDKLEKETPSMKDYRITSANDEEYGTISFAEIYKHKPCHEEFLKLLEEYTDPLTIEDFEDAEKDSVIIRNLNWFVDKGLLTKQSRFKPFNFTIHIKSEDMLCELWHRMNNNIASIWEHCSKGSEAVPQHDDSRLCSAIWHRLDVICTDLGMKKD